MSMIDILSIFCETALKWWWLGDIGSGNGLVPSCNNVHADATVFMVSSELYYAFTAIKSLCDMEALKGGTCISPD